MHREQTADFWVSVAAILALFVPIWGILLAPSGLIRHSAYLLVVGVPALAVVIGALIYGIARNRVLLNRFLVGYAAGLLGTLVFGLFLTGVSLLLPEMPNIPLDIGNSVLGKAPNAPLTPIALAVGMAYHFLLNGAAWGAAYSLLFGKVPWWLGLFFGLFIWAVLVLSPIFYAWGYPRVSSGAVMLALLLIAHFLYGGVVGTLNYRWVFPEIGIEGAKAIRPLYA